ncbi:MAG: hypothetical protein HOQ24_03820, partial [Mycobacteriaceae bacterium]|nr:hypothetical protein [Mycobacteriaceae bacterium]
MPTGSGVERSIETVLGIERPDGAPQQMRTLALAWRNAGELFIASASACERHADTLLNSGEGHVAAAVAAGSRRTAQLARSSGECCLSLGAETDDAAVGVEFGQLSWDYIGLITLIQLSAAAYAALCTGGVAAPQALQIRLAGRHAVATALRKVLEFIATGGIKAHMKRHVLLAGSAAWGGALGAAVPLAAQLKQMTEGRRDQVDWQSAVTSGAAGLVGGLAGAAAASALSPLVGRVAARIAGAGGARGPRIGAAVFSTTALGV